MLSELLTIKGIVVRGDQLGRKLGFPTANLAFRDKEQRKLAEEFETRVSNQGLYFGQATILDRVGLNIYDSPTLIFIGPRLILGESKIVWEAHIINKDSGRFVNKKHSKSASHLERSFLSADPIGEAPGWNSFPEFYGAMLQLTLLRKLRDNMHFDSLEELKAQMLKDLAEARLCA